MQLTKSPIPDNIPNLPVSISNSEERQIIQLVQSTGKLYEDPLFSYESLYKSDPKLAKDIVAWKRPREINSNAQLFVNGIDEGDVIQGDLGNCWFLSALIVLATHGNDAVKNLFVSEHPECGFYQVKFFKDGEWKVVVVDDRLPVNKLGQPAFARCRDPSEFWVPIIEKAYAKLHGGYEIIGFASNLSYALTDLTGEAAEVTDIDYNESLWHTLLKNKTEGFLMGCSFSEPGRGEEETPLGILKNHAYGILDCVQVSQFRLLCIRNPWGDAEWRGRWSDGSKEWTPQILKQLNYHFEDDGTFYMCFEDWATNFNRLHTLRLLTDNIGEVWSKFEYKGEWNGESAGGCLNHATFTKNPQYSIVVSQETQVFISLHQLDRRYNFRDRSSYPSIGLVILIKDQDDDYRTHIIDKGHRHSCSHFTPNRESTIDVVLKPGTYVVVPCTYEPKVISPFYLQIYSRFPTTIKVLTMEKKSIEYKGHWSGRLAGGCPPNNNTWRDNPQYLLTVHKKGTVPFTLQQIPVTGQLIHMGVFLWMADAVGRRNLDSHDAIWNSALINSELLQESLLLDPGRYIIMLCPFNPRVNVEYNFKILYPDCTLDLVSEWRETRIESEWKSGQSGGCGNHSTWFNNPKYHINVTSKAVTNVILNTDDELPVGFYIYDKSLQQCKVRSNFVTTNSLFKNFSLEPGEYILIACTFNPNIFANFTLIAYTDNEITLQPYT